MTDPQDRMVQGIVAATLCGAAIPTEFGAGVVVGLVIALVCTFVGLSGEHSHEADDPSCGAD